MSKSRHSRQSNVFPNGQNLPHLAPLPPSLPPPAYHRSTRSGHDFEAITPHSTPALLHDDLRTPTSPSESDLVFPHLDHALAEKRGDLQRKPSATPLGFHSPRLDIPPIDATIFDEQLLHSLDEIFVSPDTSLAQAPRQVRDGAKEADA